MDEFFDIGNNKVAFANAPMHDIICPHCGKAFKIDEAGYADILKQVRDADFEQQLHERLVLAERDKRSAVALAKSAVTNQLQCRRPPRRTARSRRCRASCRLARPSASWPSRRRSPRRKGARRAGQRAGAARHGEPVCRGSWPRPRLPSDLQPGRRKDAEIQQLRRKLASLQTQQKLAVREAVTAVERERDALQGGLERAALEKELAEKSLKDKYETQMRDRDDAIERLKDMKARLSTKMVGETLEQHCEVEFNRIRATAFPNAYFEKDNDARTGSKGDYIFRDRDAGRHRDRLHHVRDEERERRTATKNRNEDFLKELDKDRTEKGASTRCWSRCWSPRASCTTAASSMCSTATRRCT
jgi:hypothetical protein